MNRDEIPQLVTLKILLISVNKIVCKNSDFLCKIIDCLVLQF